MGQLGLIFNQNNLNGLPNKQYNAALYLRFSKDDGKLSDNSSIVTQEMTLTRFCADNGYAVYDIYKDDGFTGLNYDRPDFQRLLGDIESGKVNLVITKDLSRLGRDYIQTGYYTEIYFAERNVRYIAVNDGVDTIKVDNDIAPFKNILNDMYSRDISRKIKAAIRQRAMKGMFINSHAPYGYKKHPEDKNRLAIDEEAAETVKEIFRLALEGKGSNTIVKILTGRRILIPSAYKVTQGITSYNRYNKCNSTEYDYRWKYATVLHIMRNRIYTGDMINHRKEIANYKTKKVVKVPKERQIIVQNTHEPLIDREDFERVQALMTARHTPVKRKHDNIFRGILFCSDCGHRLSLIIQHLKAKGKEIRKKHCYRCNNHYKNREACPYNHSIYHDDLYCEVLSDIKRMIKAVMDDDGLLAEALKRVEGQNGNDKQAAEKGKLETRLNALATIVKKLYEDYAAELLDGDNYKAMLADYQAEQQRIKARLSEIDESLNKANDVEENFKKLKQIAAEYANYSELSAEMLKALVERIELERVQKIDGKPTQRISITYRFIKTNV